MEQNANPILLHLGVFGRASSIGLETGKTEVMGGEYMVWRENGGGGEEK